MVRMASVTPPATVRVTPPSWPTAMLGLSAVLATLSLAQGIVDVAIPAITGTEPFGFLFEQTERVGPAFLIGYVFVHNLGLACLVPGYGFLAAWFERRTANRFIIGVLLASAVITSLLVALQFVLTARERFDLPTALTIFFVEAAAVLAVAVPAARELRGFVPTRRYEWSLVTPFRRLAVPLTYACVMLAAVSIVEAWTILRAG